MRIHRVEGQSAHHFPAPTRAPLALHARLPSFAPTPLRSVPALADLLGVATVHVKDESCRFGLPAFKILGASWAALQAIAERHAGAREPWRTLDELRARLRAPPALTLVAATDGNHGRAVAHIARQLGLPAKIVVPANIPRASLHGIETEGATVIHAAGGYDEAVRTAAALASEDHIVVSDMARDEHDPVPAWVIDGYSTLFWEIDDALAGTAMAPDVVFIQMGVGSLAVAAVRHYLHPGRADRPRIIGVEPERAACVLESVVAARRIALPGIQDSAMTGLNCGTPTAVGWTELSRGIGPFLAIEDHWAMEARAQLAAVGITTGATGAAGLAGALALRDAERRCEGAEAILQPGRRILLLVTEGDVDALPGPTLSSGRDGPDEAPV